VISLLLDEAGVFHWAALHVARWGGGRGRVLFPLVVVLGAAIAAVFANDGAALLLTPIVVAILVRLDFPPAASLAFIVATGFVADTTSLPLVISNLVNIVSANFFAVTFDRYAAVMVPVDVVSLVATLAVLWLYYGRQVPRSYPVAELEAPASAIRDPLVFRAAFPLLGALLVAYFVTAPLGIPVSVVTGSGALVLLVLAGRLYRSGRDATIPVGKVLRGAPWQIVVFSLGMYLVVYGLRNAGLTDDLARVLVWLGGQGLWAAAIGTGFVAAGLSSVMNNMPGVLVGALAIQQAHDLPPLVHEAMVYANVIGCDLGPKFTPIGSLATLLWLHVLGTKGRTITWGEYMRVGLTITPPVLLVTLAALALWLSLVCTP
ncbi:MAG: arsenic transporter, partial [Janthinobacterium lividum]